MKKQIFILIIVSIFLVSLVSAELTSNIEVKDSFSLGEQVLFNYTLISDVNTQIIFMPYVLCSSAPVALLEEKTIQLQANQLYAFIYSDQVVQDWFESQMCTAYVQILSPIQKTVSKNFSIVTDPFFEFKIKLDKKVFIKNENIYLNYSSDVSGLKLGSKLTYPDGSIKNINLPTTIKAEQVGNYNLEVSASKEGYKTIKKKEQFGVIEGNAMINPSNEDNFTKENLNNTSSKKLTNSLFYILIGIIVLMIILALKLSKGKHK